MRVLGVEHVAITAPKELEQDVLEWYRKCFSLEPIDKPAGTRAVGGWFKAGSQQIQVTIDEHNPPKIAHFGIVVDDWDEVLQRLRGAGCHIEQASAIPGRRRFYTRDPAGNRIQVIAFDEAGET